MKIENLKELLILELQDIYSAEKQLIRALPKLKKLAEHSQLQDAIGGHLLETKEQKKRLEHIFTKWDEKGGGHRCKAMAGLLREANGVAKERIDSEVIDAALIAALQRIEHYEIAAYGCARTFAQLLGEDAIVELLQESLDEEGAADKKLTQIALDHANPEAAQAESPQMNQPMQHPSGLSSF